MPYTATAISIYDSKTKTPKVQKKQGDEVFLPVDDVNATTGFSTLDGYELSISDMRAWVTEAEEGPFIPWETVKKELMREISDLKKESDLQKI